MYSKFCILDATCIGDILMTDKLQIDGYAISVDDRKMIIDHTNLSEPLEIIFDPLQASQLSMLLNKVVPDDYGVRSNFRVPVTEDMGLATTIQFENQSCSAVTKSISSSGFFACEIEQDLRLKTGCECRIDFEFHGDIASIDAIVVRANTKGVAFAFTSDEESTDTLSKIVMKVQRNWISTKPV